jgi:hypothetical protein
MNQQLPGLLLALLPALKHLTTDNIYQMRIDVRDWDYEQNWDLEPLYRTALQRHVLDPREWYATKYFDHGVCGIAGFEISPASNRAMRCLGGSSLCLH